MEPFFVTICVKLEKPIEPIESEEQTLVGYYLNVGVTAINEQDAVRMIQEYVTDGSIDLKKIEWNDIGSVAPDIFAKFTSIRGIWYKSGRILFPE